MKQAIYLSHPLSSDTPLYGGAKNIKIKSDTSISTGDTANSIYLAFSNHSGTHIDVPYHFFDDGKKLNEYDPNFWIFRSPICLDLPCIDGYLIQYQDVAELIKPETDLLLIRTGYEKFRMEKKYWASNPGLSSNLAIGIREHHPNIRSVGVDVISITSRLHREEGRKAHREFLGTNYSSDPIVVIEDMSLLQFTPNISNVIIAPLIIDNSDGAPCTIIAY